MPSTRTVSASMTTMMGVATAALIVLVALAARGAQSQSVLCPIRAFDIRLQPGDVEPRSFFTAAGQTATVTRSRTFPRIIVRAVDSNNNIDTQVTNVDVVVSSNDPTVNIDATTSTVRMYSGEAHFTNLTVLNGDLLQLNFTAVSDQLQRRLDNGTIFRYFLPLHRKFVTTGLVRVERQLIDQFALQFLTTSSFVRAPGVPMTLVSGVTVPTIRLQVVTSAYTQYRPLLGLANNFSVTVDFDGTPPPGTTLSGRLQPIVSGFATFDGIVITTTANAVPGLVFLLTDPPLAVRTGPITMDSLRDNTMIMFNSAAESFIYTPGQEFSAQVSVKLPRIIISVRDNMLRPAAAGVGLGLVITARCGRADLANNVAGVVGGVAVFDNLLFFGLNHEDFRPYVLTFTAGTQAGFKGTAATRSLHTGVIMLSVNVVPAYRFRFLPGYSDSFFNAPFERKQLVRGNIVTPPLRIELLNSDNTRDTVTLGRSVAFTVENGRFAASSSVLQFDQGVAQSLDLRFEQTSTNDDSYVVLTVTSTIDPNVRIVTGRVNVTNAVSNFDLRFQPYGAGLFSNVGQSSFATIGIALPPIAIELISSGNAIDTESNEITITATAEGATLSGAFVRVSNGVAVFRDLTFVSDVPGDFKITFTAGDAGSAPVGGKSLVTGIVTLFATVTFNVRPRFLNDSYIAFAGQSRPLTLDTIMPDINVELASSDHSPARAVNGTARLIVAELSLSNGAFLGGYKTSGITVTNGIVSIKRLRVVSGLDPVLSICFRSSVTSSVVPVADGACISTGPLRTYPKPTQVIGHLSIYQPLTTLPRDSKVAKSEVFAIAVAMYDTAGVFAGSRVNIDFDIKIDSSVQFEGATRVSMNRSTGIAIFSGLSFNKDFSAGVTPSLTFSAAAPLSAASTPISLLNVLPISTPLLAIQGASANSGVDVVAEVLTDTLSFDADAWMEAVAKRLNVEPQRILQLRVFRGKSADPDPDGITEDTVTKLPSWSGTRFDLRFRPPLPTSRDTRTAADLANLFVNLQPSCRIGELKLRKAYPRSTDQSCDWFIFDAQLTSVRSCILSKGEPGYCQCHVPLFTFMGKRCLGLPSLTSLCLNVLLVKDAANCQQPAIVDVCKLLQFPDAPRTAVAASGAVLFMCFIPLFYLYSGGFFHKINLPTAEQSRITKTVFVASDEKDLL